MERNDICEAMGYLSNPLVDMHYDIQVPSGKRIEFESSYENLTGLTPISPGSGGYSVLGQAVDKRAVQYRISYSPVGNVPPYLQSISRPAPGSSAKKRVSSKELLIEMFRSGFLMGSLPSRPRIVSRIDTTCFIRFEFGYVSAFSHQKPLRFDKFSGGFSAVSEAPQSEFSLYDEQAATPVCSTRAGRSAAFRHHVLQAYNNQCCVCAGSLVDLFGVYETEAAHIVPKRLSGSDDIRNGLALCRKHHWAFDRGMFSINDDRCVVVPSTVSSIVENISLGHYDGCQITCSRESSFAPHPVALEWHREHILSGSD